MTPPPSPGEQLSLPPTNVTVTGAFNPAIIRPDWLRLNVFKDTQLIDVLLTSGAPGGSLFYRRQDLGLVWYSDRERLVVWGPIVKASKVACDILNMLKETPLTAAGINFQKAGVILGPKEWLAQLESARERAHKLLNGPSVGSSFMLRSRRSDGVLVMSTIREIDLPMAAVDLNYHVDAVGADDPAKSAMICAHIARAAEFEQDAARIQREVFGDDD